MALLGILLVALNLRTAVAAVSPIVSSINVDIPLDAVTLGIIGMIPPIAFSLCGIFGAIPARRFGLERFLAIAMVTMAAGHLLRSLAGSFTGLFLGSVLALAGAGVGNILLPPLVKRYFPDRIGLVTTLYVAIMSFSTAIPAALAAPITEANGWRLALGIWSIVAIVGLVPWVLVLLAHRRERAAAASGSSGAEIADLAQPREEFSGKIWHSRVAWTIALVFAVSSFEIYAGLAWLPQLLEDIAHVSKFEAGNLLALYSLMGLPGALFLPVLTTRMKNVSWLLQLGLACFVLGYLGLLLAPTTVTWLWVALIGSGPMLFPICLTLINARTRSAHTSVALSGFAQGVGYALGALGPLLVGFLHDVTGGWTAPLILLLAIAAACAIAAAKLRKPTSIEDDLERA
ncbi:MAG: transporter, family, cyanate transporter [Microbacteriaceae bacterium]|nr:transporter, family, cyanate transporter [Microbacteriaceae bacterium]